MSDQWQQPDPSSRGQYPPAQANQPGWHQQPPGGPGSWYQPNQQPPPGYGPPQYQPQPYGYGTSAYGAYGRSPSNGLATAGMVLGIVFLCLFFLGLLTFVGAIIFGGVGMSRAAKIGGMKRSKIPRRRPATAFPRPIWFLFSIGLGLVPLVSTPPPLNRDTID